MSNIVKQEQQQPVYAAPPSPVRGDEPSQPPKKSRRWIWITLGVIGGLLVIGGIVLAVGRSSFTGSTIKTIAGPTIVADQYYTAIRNQDYTKAYTYWDSNEQKVYHWKCSPRSLSLLISSLA